MFSHSPSRAFRLRHFSPGGSPSPPPDSSCWFPHVRLPPPCAGAALGVVLRVRLAGELICLEITASFRQVVFHLGQFPDLVLSQPWGPVLAPQEGLCRSGDQLPGVAKAP